MILLLDGPYSGDYLATRTPPKVGDIHQLDDEIYEVDWWWNDGTGEDELVAFWTDEA